MGLRRIYRHDEIPLARPQCCLKSKLNKKRLDKTHLISDNVFIVDQNSIPLRDALRQERVFATFLEDVSSSLIEEVEAVWRPEALRLKREALVRGVSEDDLPLQHDHWDWKAKKKNAAPESRFFGVYCDDMMQGLMKLSPKQPCQLAEQSEKSLVYIDYIEIAPWNLPHLAEVPQYRAIGSFFLEAAIQYSQQTGTEGRIGLHSLRQAEQFYRNSDMTDCGSQKIGYSSLSYRYFEMTPMQARRFVEG